jgi:micrococcal nuclease
MNLYHYKATVQRIVDGDTVDLEVSLGMDTYRRIRCRLGGINAPESRTRDLEEKARGLAAKKRLDEILEGQTIILQSESYGKYGRVIGTLWIQESQHAFKNVNQTLVNEGHASPYDGGKR